MKNWYILAFFVVSWMIFCSTALAVNCVQPQGAMDIGSGTTKVLAVSVDICEKKILNVLFEDRIPLAFNEAYEKSLDQNIPKNFWQESLPQIRMSLDKFKNLGIKKVSAVATAVFRNAKNGRDVIAVMGEKLGVSIQIISQDQEAELGFWSVLAFKNWQPAEVPVVVWDIGGGSMQMFSLDRGRPRIFRGNLASVSFKNEILRVLQFKNPQEFSSPNPLGRNRMAAVQLAKNHAALNVPKFFKELKNPRWLGIGGVLSVSVQKQVQKEAQVFTEEEVDETLQLRSVLNDEQIQSAYKVTEVTNLALVLGYMRALNIRQVETVPAALGQGLIYKNLFAATNSK